MSFVNLHKPSPEVTVLPDDELYGPDPYDINFAFPLYLETLESDKVRLTPFVPREHVRAYWDVMGPLGVEPFRYYPFYQATLPEFLTIVELYARRMPEHTMFAIFDKTGPQEKLAGVIAMMNTRGSNSSTELGYVQVFPAFRRTHVAKTAVGLFLRYLLQLPSQSPPGLGFRRVAWSAHLKNEPSKGLALSVGMKLEGIMRWPWVLGDEVAAEGEVVRAGDSFEGKRGRHSSIFAICWDDWENGGRERVDKLIQ